MLLNLRVIHDNAVNDVDGSEGSANDAEAKIQI